MFNVLLRTAKNIVDLTIREKINCFILIPMIIIVLTALLVIWKKNNKNIASLKKIYHDYDDLKLYFYWLDTGYIEKFSSNEKIKNFCNMIKNEKKEGEKKLKQISDIIKIYSLEVRNFHSNKKLLDIIKKNLKIIESFRNNIEKNIKKIKNSIIKINDLSFSLINIYNNSLNFYHFYLANKNYKNDEFKKIILKIRSTLLEIQNKISYSRNILSIKDSLGKIIIDLNEFINWVRWIYIYDEVIKYLNMIIKTIINPFLSSAEESSVIIQLKQQIIIGKDALNKLDYYVHQLDFEQSNNYALIAQRSIENYWNKIKNEQKVEKIITYNFQLINQIFTELEGSIDSIFESLNNINSNFDDNDSIIKKNILSFKNKLTLIISKFQMLKNSIIIQGNNAKEENKQNIINLLALTKRWISEWNEFSNEITEKNKRFQLVNDLSCEIQNTIAHLKGLNGYSLSFNKNDEFNQLNVLQKRVDEIYANFSNDYSKTKSELLEIKESLNSLIRKINIDYVLFNFLQALFFFLNKYRYEAKEINDTLTNIEANVKEKNIEDSLNVLIDVGQKIKLSSKMSGEKIR